MGAGMARGKRIIFILYNLIKIIFLFKRVFYLLSCCCVSILLIEDYSVLQHKGSHHGHHGDGHRHSPLPYNNPFGHLAIIHDIEFDDYELQHNYDNNKQHMDNTVKKHLDNMKKHR